MAGQLSAALEDQIRSGIERDGVTAEQIQPAGIGDESDARGQAVDVDLLGGLALQTEHQRPVAAVATARGRQRAVQVHADLADAGKAP